MKYIYRETVLDELSRHGIIPCDDTPPELIHEFVNNLYLIEIRSLKKQRLAGSVPKDEYANRVEELRRRYPILSLPVRFWLKTK